LATNATHRKFHVVIEKSEDGYYIANIVELPGCHTQARTLCELDKRAKEAIELYLEYQGTNAPEIEFVAVKEIWI
jgi:predicted RNase H-like HicB family nuclease